jgi:hypothetical protein
MLNSIWLTVNALIRKGVIPFYLLEFEQNVRRQEY